MHKSRGKYKSIYLILQNKTFIKLCLLNLFIEIYFFHPNNNENIF